MFASGWRRPERDDVRSVPRAPASRDVAQRDSTSPARTRAARCSGFRPRRPTRPHVRARTAATPAIPQQRLAHEKPDEREHDRRRLPPQDRAEADPERAGERRGQRACRRHPSRRARPEVEAAPSFAESSSAASPHVERPRRTRPGRARERAGDQLRRNHPLPHGVTRKVGAIVPCVNSPAARTIPTISEISAPTAANRDESLLAQRLASVGASPTGRRRGHEQPRARGSEAPARGRAASCSASAARRG